MSWGPAVGPLRSAAKQGVSVRTGRRPFANVASTRCRTGDHQAVGVSSSIALGATVSQFILLNSMKKIVDRMRPQRAPSGNNTPSKPTSLNLRKSASRAASLLPERTTAARHYLIVKEEVLTPDSHLASAGWAVTSSQVPHSQIASAIGSVVEEGDADHPDDLVNLHIAARLSAVVKKTKFPGTEFELPAQEFLLSNAGELNGKTFLRFKTTGQDLYRVRPQDNIFRAFSVFVPSTAEKIKSVVLTGHGERSGNKPFIHLSLLPRDFEVRYFGQPGKLLVSRLDEVGEKLPFGSVKMGQDGLCYVKRSARAKSDPNLNTFKKLFDTKERCIPNFDLQKISPNPTTITCSVRVQGETSTLTTQTGMTEKRPGDDLFSLGRTAVRHGVIVATPSRRSSLFGFDKDTPDVGASLKMIHALKERGLTDLRSVEIFACLQEAESVAGKEIKEIKKRHDQTQYITGSGINTRSNMISYSEGADNLSDGLRSGIFTADMLAPSDKAKEGGQWEIVGPRGEFLENTDRNRVVCLSALNNCFYDEGVKNSSSEYQKNSGACIDEAQQMIREKFPEMPSWLQMEEIALAAHMGQEDGSLNPEDIKGLMSYSDELRKAGGPRMPASDLEMEKELLMSGQSTVEEIVAEHEKFSCFLHPEDLAELKAVKPKARLRMQEWKSAPCGRGENRAEAARRFECEMFTRNWSGLGLTSLPQEIFEKKDFIYINLSGNSILAAEIEALRRSLPDCTISS